MKVLCDAIHADLWESLRILFEDRLGWELYAPTGMEWYDSGIWQFEKAHIGDAVARQFLQQWDSDDAGSGAKALGYQRRAGTTHPAWQRRVTMEQANDLKPDIVVSTLAENDMGWAGWAADRGAVFGIQIGNQGQPALWGAAKFALLSSTTPGINPWMPHVYYHQEFSLKDFHADGGAGGLHSTEVATCVQCYAGGPDYPLFQQAAAATSDVAIWRHYGHCGVEDELWGGNSPTTSAVAARMHRARIAWHWKRWSDGYGHVIHNWAAIGRPMLVTADYYRDKLAGPLFIEGETSFNLERMTAGDIEATVRRLLRDDEEYTRMSVAAAARFREVVDFAAEADAIRAMFSGVLP